jgi:hypothetical protein
VESIVAPFLAARLARTESSLKHNCGECSLRNRLDQRDNVLETGTKRVVECNEEREIGSMVSSTSCGWFIGIVCMAPTYTKVCFSRKRLKAKLGRRD